MIDLEKLRDDIFKQSSTQQRKVARVFGQIWLDYSEKNSGVTYEALEKAFFVLLHKMISDGEMLAFGTIRADNMQHSEIALA